MNILASFYRNFTRWLMVGFVLFFIFVIAAAFFVARYRPPRDFVFASGSVGGAYYAFAQEYKALVDETDYNMTVLPTAGSVENLQKLSSGEAQVGFVQGGTGYVVDTDELESLGSVFYEPLWVFYRKDAFPQGLTSLGALQGKNIAVGEEGSGSAILAQQVLLDNEITEANSQQFQLPISGMVEGLESGSVDAAMFVLSPTSGVIEELLRNPEFDLWEVENSLAYHRRFPFLTPVTLAQGVLNLADNIPDRDWVLLATTATLVGRYDTPPDITRLILTEAQEVHGPGGILEEAGEFPSTMYVDIPMGKDATHFLEQGPTGLDRWLPFWLSSRLEWFIFVILPLLVLLYPLFRSMPALFGSVIRVQIYRWYLDVNSIERRVPKMSLDEIGEQIEWLEELNDLLSRTVRVPIFYMHDYYELRMHINLVATLLEKRRDELVAHAKETESNNESGSDVDSDAGAGGDKANDAHETDESDEPDSELENATPSPSELPVN